MSKEIRKLLENIQKLEEQNYLDIKVLKKFRETNSGVLFKDGTLHPVFLFQHIDFFKKLKDQDVKDLINDYSEEYANSMEEFELDIPEDEHPEWHNFEIWTDEFQSEYVKKLFILVYKKGWGRLGIMPYEKKMELECAEQFKNQLEKYAKEIAEMLNLELIVTSYKL